MGLSELMAAKKQVGTKQTLRALAKDAVKAVYIAGDADRRVVAPVIEACQAKSIPTYEVETKAVLGKACGIDVGTAVVALLKE